MDQRDFSTRRSFESAVYNFYEGLIFVEWYNPMVHDTRLLNEIKSFDFIFSWTTNNTSHNIAQCMIFFLMEAVEKLKFRLGSKV